MRLIALVLFMVASATSASAQTVPMGAGYGAIDAERDVDAVTLGLRFCEARLLDDMSRVSGHFAPKLIAVLDGVPPGTVPWQSIDIRPTGCTIGVVNGTTDTIGVLIEVRYTAPGAAWSDVLNLERTPESWLINNVFYEGGGNLRFRLFEAAD